MDNFDMYVAVCDYLEEAVYSGDMTEDDAYAIESEAYDRYIDNVGYTAEEALDAIEDAMDDDMDEFLSESVALYEHADDIMFAVIEAKEDTTEQKELTVLNSAFDEYADVFHTNIMQAKKAIKAKNKDAAKKQLKDAKVALVKMENIVNKAPDDAPQSFYRALRLKGGSVLTMVAGIATVAGAIGTGFAKFSLNKDALRKSNWKNDEVKFVNKKDQSAFGARKEERQFRKDNKEKVLKWLDSNKEHYDKAAYKDEVKARMKELRPSSGNKNLKTAAIGAGVAAAGAGLYAYAKYKESKKGVLAMLKNARKELEKVEAQLN